MVKEMIISHLKKSFRGQDVLKDMNLVMKAGKIYGIAGYNGSGKTVFIKCICGLLNYEGGRIILDDQIIESGEILKNVGVIIEGPSYLKEKTAYQNLNLLYQIKNAPDKEHLYEILKKVGLQPESKKTVNKYSLGMKQRLGIAQAIMENPDILLLDEPMNGLDKQGILDMHNLLEDMKKQNKIILLASHNKYDMDILCDEVYEIDKGELVKIKEEK